MDPSHSSNRNFFESGLELKCLFFFGLALTVVISVSFYMYWKVTEVQIKLQNPRTANILVEQDMILKHWKLSNQTDSGSGSFTNRSPGKSGKEDPNTIGADFSQFMELITEGLRKEKFKSRALRSKYYQNSFKPQASEDSLPQNDFERDLLERFQRIPTNWPNNTDSDSADYIDKAGEYHYYRPVRVNDKSCTDTCHPPSYDDDPVLGDLIAVIHVAIPKPPARDAIAKYWALLLGLSIVTAFLALIAFYMVIRLIIIRPLRNLRDVAEGISRGDISKRADLHTGDEFELLGAAFNRMLRHLVTAQEKLRGTNNELEYRVNALAHMTTMLNESNRLKSDFMATMSHELRTPLNSIIGFSEVLASIATLDDKQKRYVNNILQSGQSLLTMINSILDMAKLEAGRMEVQLSSFQIGQVVSVQSDLAKPLLDKKNIDLELDIPSNLEPVRQDEQRIHQILNNLLSNAIKFTPEGGKIKIMLRREERPPLPAFLVDTGLNTATRLKLAQKEIPYIILKVRDTGVGISKEDQAIVFEKFRQAKSSTMTREFSGTGLGLSIVKELCKMLEGEISLESDLGTGSTFTVQLPWLLEQRTRSESEIMAEIQQFTLKGTTQLKKQ
ncbi:MAG: ATP-binding protein [Thermoguttaceae bacterium]